jgi:hypothetical protein
MLLLLTPVIYMLRNLDMKYVMRKLFRVIGSLAEQ